MRWSLLLLGLLCLSALAQQASARTLKQADDHSHDECDCNDDCHTDEYCSKGDCILKRDDGEDCVGDEQCLSGMCHHSWVFGSSCATLCKTDEDCPSSRSLCNTNPYNPYSLLLRGGQADNTLLKRGGGEQPEQPQEDEDDEDDEDDDEDDEDDDEDDEDQPEQHEEDQQRGVAVSKQQPEQPEQDEDEEQDQQDRRHHKHRKSSVLKSDASDASDADDNVEKKHKKKKDDDDKKGGDDQQAGICVECMEDKDCKKSEYCQRGFKKDAHSCKELGKACASYGDCPQGEYCDSTVDRCRPYFGVFSRIFSRSL